MTVRPAVRFLAVCVLGWMALHGHAQTYPTRPVAIVVPYPPGAATDLIARLVQPKLQAAFNQPVIIENRPGANGSVGAALVAKSRGDGYRILLATQPIVAINPHLQKDMGFDPFKDLAPLTSAVAGVMGIAINTLLPINNLAELFAYAKKNPGKLTYGSPGAGSPQHIGGLLLGQRAQIDWTHIPYKGGGPMVSDLLAGHITVGIGTLSVFTPLMSDRRLRLIAVGEKARFAGAPDIPTISETLPGFELTTWLAFYAPSGLPEDVSKLLADELVKALHADDVRRKLQESGLLVNASGPEPLARTGRADYELYGRVIRDEHITDN